MYINDIAEKLISPTRLFADDTSFSYSNRDELQIKTVIHHDLEELDEWPKKWLMTLMVKLIRIPYPTIIPYFTSILKNWSDIN
jgi:hypothetical protein